MDGNGSLAIVCTAVDAEGDSEISSEFIDVIARDGVFFTLTPDEATMTCAFDRSNFDYSQAFTSLAVYKDGNLLQPGTGYTISVSENGIVSSSVVGDLYTVTEIDEARNLT